MRAVAVKHGTVGFVQVTLKDGTEHVIPRYDAVMRAKGLLEMTGVDNVLPGGDEYTIHVAEQLIKAASEAKAIETGEGYKSTNVKLLLATMKRDDF